MTSISIIKSIVTERMEVRPKECQYPECGGKTEARGLCKKHYSFFKRNVQPYYPVERYKFAGFPDMSAFVGDPCSMCGEPSKILGFCKKHYARYRLNFKRELTLAEESA